MKISNVLFPILMITLIVARVTSYSSVNESFLQCLGTYSHPSNPISNTLQFPGNSSYSSVLRFYMRNHRLNESRVQKPKLIIAASHASHVQAAVICANWHGLKMKIRSGGRDFEGVYYVSYAPFFILDMLNLRSINVNVEEETAWVGSGATLEEVYYRICERSNVHGFRAGMCPKVGAGGHFSGGGFGTLVRKYGLAADNVVDAKLVDFNGQLLDRASMGEDLFWAITRGGVSSFGVVIAFKIRLVKVPPIVTFSGIRITYDQIFNYVCQVIFNNMIYGLTN